MTRAGTGPVVGIDVGGTGSRLALRLPGGPRREIEGDRVAVTSAGSSVPDVVRGLLHAAARAWPDDVGHVVGIGVGATGVATLVDRPQSLVGVVLQEVATWPGAVVDPGVAVAADAVTAHLGALGGDGGAVVALGTGAIAVGSDGHELWRRVDGWGHLLGDRGGGAWIGRRALEAALRAADGVDDGGVALLAAARRRFGDPLTWPGQLYPRADRAGVLAGFAADVAAVAASGDPVARDLLVEAGTEAARSALAALGALGADVPPRVAPTGGLFRAGGALVEAFDAHLAARPDVVVTAALGDPLDGALLLAERAAAGQVRPVPGLVWSGVSPVGA